MQPSSDDLTKKIAEWLNQQGYPLEMSAALAFQKAGFTVSLADAYIDHETAQLREIDVTALRWSDMSKPAALQVCARIECKTSRDKPWVIFVSQAQPERFLPFEHVCSSATRIFLINVFKKPGVWKSTAALPMFGPSYVAHGLAQAFRTHEDMTHKALSSAVKASVDRALQFDKLETIEAMTSGPRLCVLVFPIIVLDGRLFECFVTETGETRLAEKTSSFLLWHGIDGVNASTLVRIVTKEALGDLVSDFADTTNALIELVHDNIPDLASALSAAHASILRHQ